MKKFLISIVLGLSLLFTGADFVSADILVAESSAQLKSTASKKDERVIKLRKYLEGHNSPLVPYADEFVLTADKYNLDWRLVAAISGVESTFGKRIPAGSYNAYGWAGGNYRFASWEDSIEIVSKSLKEDYIEKGAPSLTKIGRRYCPPNPAWVWKVKFFMARIDSFPVSFTI